ncbi:MAG: HlyD family secretion protein [Deltaproteobacteria bacterium]
MNKKSFVLDDRKKRRLLLFLLLAIVICVGAAAYWVYWKQVGSRYVSTENAYTAADIALVTAEIDGTVEEIRVVDTQKVKKGDVLVVIDATDTKLALKQAEAEKARAQAQKSAATSDLERAGIDLKRREALADSGSVSGDELTRAKNGHATALSAIESARAAIALTQARHDKAKVDLERTVIRSPIDGIIARRQVQLGQRLQPSALLLSVVPLHGMYVNANYKEVELEKVRVGQKVKLISDLHGNDVVFTGVVEGFSGGTGSAFALIPAQNATGNWIKVVQRLPVRIRLNPLELEKYPLSVGLSMSTTIDLRSSRQ